MQSVLKRSDHSWRLSGKRRSTISEADICRNDIETYTKPIHPRDEEELEAIEKYTNDFSKIIVQLQPETVDIIGKYPKSVGKYYDQLVTREKKVSHEEFWQRYFYKCNGKRVINIMKKSKSAPSLFPLDSDASSSSIQTDSSPLRSASKSPRALKSSADSSPKSKKIPKSPMKKLLKKMSFRLKPRKLSVTSLEAEIKSSSDDFSQNSGDAVTRKTGLNQQDSEAQPLGPCTDKDVRSDKNSTSSQEGTNVLVFDLKEDSGEGLALDDTGNRPPVLARDVNPNPQNEADSDGEQVEEIPTDDCQAKEKAVSVNMEEQEMKDTGDNPSSEIVLESSWGAIEAVLDDLSDVVAKDGSSNSDVFKEEYKIDIILDRKNKSALESKDPEQFESNDEVGRSYGSDIANFLPKWVPKEGMKSPSCVVDTDKYFDDETKFIGKSSKGNFMEDGKVQGEAEVGSFSTLETGQSEITFTEESNTPMTSPERRDRYLEDIKIELPIFSESECCLDEVQIVAEDIDEKLDLPVKEHFEIYNSDEAVPCESGKGVGSLDDPATKAMASNFIQEGSMKTETVLKSSGKHQHGEAMFSVDIQSPIKAAIGPEGTSQKQTYYPVAFRFVAITILTLSSLHFIMKSSTAVRLGNGMCAPVAPGTTLSSGMDAVFDAPWWASKEYKTTAFWICGTRPRTRIEWKIEGTWRKRHRLTMYHFKDSTLQKMNVLDNLQYVDFSPEGLKATSKKGEITEMDGDWILKD